jgi:Bacterial SH3 domain
VGWPGTTGRAHALGRAIDEARGRSPRPKPAVIVHETAVRKTAAADAGIVLTLKPGEPVKIKRTEGIWALIEQNGSEVGYVPVDDVVVIRR